MSIQDFIDFGDLVANYFANLELSEIAIGILVTLGICLSIQLFFYLYYYASVARNGKALKDGNVKHVIKRPPVSIIVVSRYDSENLAKCLPSILEQSYPNYEVVVVNDGTTNDTTILLDNLKKKYSHLRTTYLPEDAKYMSRKKMCMTVGIKAAFYDYLVFTDSDCVADTRDWLTEIMRNFNEETDLVLGFNHNKATDNCETLWQKFINFDNVFSTIKYMSYAMRGLAYSGTIKNMAYRKEKFFENRGFASNLNIEGGEDDIFITEVSNGTNIAVETSPNASTSINKEVTLKSFIEKKETDLENSEYYPNNVKLRINTEVTTRYLFFLIFITGIIYGIVSEEYFVTSVCGIMGLIRYGVQCYTFIKGAHALGMKGSAFLFTIFELIIPLATMYVSTVGQIGKRKLELWKV